MTGIYPILLFIATGIVWFLVARQNSRLVALFWKNHPQIARQELSGSPDRHPKNTIFFFRRRAITILRADEEVWRQRQRLKLLLLLSILVPVLGFSALFAVAFYMSNGFHK